MSPRCIVPVLAVLAALASVAGCQKVSQQAPAPELVIASFNSDDALIPTPSDLALAASKDLSPSAQRMLLQWFVEGGGFPGDQGVPISIPLNRWVWSDAAGAYVRDQEDATQPVIDPATVTTAGTARNVVVLKVDENPPRAIDVELDAENSVSGVSYTGRFEGGVPVPVRWGKLQLHKMKDANGSRRWEAGHYVFAVRGGPGGVRTTNGHPILPDRPIVLVAPNLDLTNPKNQPILRMSPAQIAQLEQLRAALWQPLHWELDPAGPTSTGSLAWVPSGSATITPAFVAASPYMLPGDIASIGTFSVAAPRPAIAVDSDSGIVPLPIDLARTGPAASGANTIGYNPAFGPAALGLTTLDGFSTTAMIFAPATIPVDASTVHGGSVHLFKKTPSGWAIQFELKASGPPAAVVAEPDPITVASGAYVAAGVPCRSTVSGGRCSSLVALQPGVIAQLNPASFSPTTTFYIPPLDEGTDYAVVVTTNVKTMPVFVPQLAVTTSLPLGRSAMARLLLETPLAMPFVLNGISLVSGSSPATATALEKMRGQLLDPNGVVSTYVATFAARNASPADVAMAYTFRTQSGIAATALKLVALPYGFGTGVVTDATFLTTAAAAQRYGAGDLLADPPGLASIAEVKLTTSNLLLGARNTGAFVDPSLTPTLVVTETITALVAIPDPANVPSTCAHLAPWGYTGALKCAPLVVYSHGLKNSKADMLPLAAALASRGFVVAAIDAEKHGERSYCSGPSQAAADAMCCPASVLGGAAALYCGNATCVPKPNLKTAVDAAAVVGVCETDAGDRAYLSYRADFRTPGGPCNEQAFLDPAEVTSPNPSCFSQKGTAYATANMLLTTNFFRVRDSIRQDVVDKSALVKALAQVGLAGNAFVTPLVARGLAVDFQKVYFLGHSYGAITGAATLAANPRVSRAVTYAGGATSMDVFNNPESRYNGVLVSLLAQGGIQPGTSDFLKAIQIAKWILDPADPANFLGYVLPGSIPAYPGAASNSPFDPAIAGTSAGATMLRSLWPEQPTTRDALVMISQRDRSVPNAQNAYYAARMGYPVVNPDPASPVSSNVQWYMDPAGTGSVSHSNLLDFVTPSLTHQAQANAGAFLLDAAPQTSPVVP